MSTRASLAASVTLTATPGFVESGRSSAIVNSSGPQITSPSRMQAPGATGSSTAFAVPQSTAAATRRSDSPCPIAASLDDPQANGTQASATTRNNTDGALNA